jgi:hypothetical protein
MKGLGMDWNLVLSHPSSLCTALLVRADTQVEASDCCPSRSLLRVASSAAAMHPPAPQQEANAGRAPTRWVTICMS